MASAFFVVDSSSFAACASSDPLVDQSWHLAAGKIPEAWVWRTGQFKAADLADPAQESTVWDSHADPDQDGRDNRIFSFPDSLWVL